MMQLSFKMRFYLLLGPKDQMTLFDNQEIKELELEIKNIRHRLFSAKSPATKRKLRDKDKEIREKIGKLLIEHGWGNETAKQLGAWDPYDQNVSSPFFDPEWMFDISNGFDVVIGNPPYIGQSGNKEMFRVVKSTEFGKKFHRKRMDYFYFFFHFGIENLAAKGVLSFITTNYFLNATCANLLREHIQKKTSITSLVNFNESKVFESAQGQHNAITILTKDLEYNKDLDVIFSDEKTIINNNELGKLFEKAHGKFKYFKLNQTNIFLENGNINCSSSLYYSSNDHSYIFQGFNNSIPLIDLCYIDQGVLTGANSVTNSHKKKINAKFEIGSGIYILTNEELDALCLPPERKKIYKAVVQKFKY